MKVKPLLGKVNEDNFITDYLSSLGITDITEYLCPNGNYDSPELYINMNEACYKLHEHLDKENKIGILVDTDNDGLCSSTAIYTFLKQFNVNVQVFQHKEAKAHGLNKTSQDMVFEDILNSNISLLIIPDASADKHCSKILTEHGIDCIILDHHSYDFIGNQYAIIVNNLQQSGTNQSASGTLVTAKFCQRYAGIYNIDCPDFTDLIAASLISDVMDLRSIENRQYLNDWIKEWNGNK